MNFRIRTSCSAHAGSAYRLEGFARSDFKQLLRILMEEYDNEAGPPVKRPSARLWADWIRTTGKRVRW